MTAFSHRYVEDCHRFRVFVLNNFLFPSCIIVFKSNNLYKPNIKNMKPKLSNDFENIPKNFTAVRDRRLCLILYEKIYYR